MKLYIFSFRSSQLLSLRFEAQEMGAGHGRTSPDTAKEVEDDASAELAYGTCGMRGWRENMEDAHLAHLEFTPELSLFGVFDGHGGGCVATYVAEHLPSIVTAELKSATHLPSASASAVPGCSATVVSTALYSSFLQMDVQLKTETAKSALSILEQAEEAAAEAEAEAENKAAEEAQDAADAAAEAAGGSNAGEEDEGLGEGHPLNDLDDDQEVSVRLGADGSLEIGVPQQAEEAAAGGAAATSAAGDALEAAADAGAAAAGEEDEDEDDGPAPVTMSLSALKRLLAGHGGGMSALLGGGSGGGGGDGGEEEGEEGESERETLHPAVHCGCTSVVSMLDRKRRTITVANAGDSRCVLSRGGVAVDLSEDHAPTLDRERARIEKAGGVITDEGRIDGNLNLSRALGDFSMKDNAEIPVQDQKVSAEPECVVEPLDGSEDFMILACDGIWERLSSQEVVDFVRARLSPSSGGGAAAGAGGKRARVGETKAPLSLSAICGELCDECLADDRDEHDGYGCDNMTVLIVDLRTLNGEREKPTKRAKAGAASS